MCGREGEGGEKKEGLVGWLVGWDWCWIAADAVNHCLNPKQSLEGMEEENRTEKKIAWLTPMRLFLRSVRRNLLSGGGMVKIDFLLLFTSHMTPPAEKCFKSEKVK